MTPEPTAQSPEATATVEERIQQIRTAAGRYTFVNSKNEPIANVSVQIKLKRHEFKLGCNAFRLGNMETSALQDAYGERFSALLNYATLPFYWGSYENQKGVTSEQRLQSMAEWCRAHNIMTKGRPLVWHEVFPEWAKALDDAEVQKRLRVRVFDIVTRFKGLIDIWDVINEATVSQRFDNGVGHWVARDGALAVVTQTLQWAHEANSDATLLYNDFNISTDFEQLVAGLVKNKAPMHTIGIQSHMHQEHWSKWKTLVSH